MIVTDYNSLNKIRSHEFKLSEREERIREDEFDDEWSIYIVSKYFPMKYYFITNGNNFLQ